MLPNNSETKHAKPLYKDPLILFLVTLFLIVLGVLVFFVTKSNKVSVAGFLNKAGIPITIAPVNLSLTIGKEQGCETQSGAVVPCSFAGNGSTYQALPADKEIEPGAPAVTPAGTAANMIFCNKPGFPVATDCSVQPVVAASNTTVATPVATSPVVTTIPATATATPTPVPTTTAPTQKPATPKPTAKPVTTTKAPTPTIVQYTSQHCQYGMDGAIKPCGAEGQDDDGRGDGLGFLDGYIIPVDQTLVRCSVVAYPLAQGCVVNYMIPHCRVTEGPASYVNKEWLCLNNGTMPDGKWLTSNYSNWPNPFNPHQFFICDKGINNIHTNCRLTVQKTDASCFNTINPSCFVTIY